ncbi:DUF2157 domain-containing protein [Fluviicola sp.]|jgi:uncharacterized membrane protein|uniref:DUF2157 domain-containing protein n=1 Tax=Fluviicola sp. TaxID=1917219 RepID=UPI0028391085|nr:DUF2157 domain-containing protein [Fluviicola sp.]MDR0802451.1 DUF2157 domain-containing protein [Fluviicola sp.]
MKKIQQEDIHIIGRNSDLTEKGIAKALTENVYNDRESWQKFFQILFISLGIGFTVSGIVFFFAYNWADLHRFVKIGMAEGLLIITTIFALFPKINSRIRNIILMGSAVLAGVLFAVYGQIYQTGANAYDFFFGWTVFVTLWVAVSNFAPLWLLYLILINTTFILYSQQVAKDWSEIFILTVLFMLNAVVLIAATVLSKFKKEISVPNWFLNTVGLSGVFYATSGIVIGIIDRYDNASFSVLILSTTALFALGVWHGLKTQKMFCLAVIPFSVIVVVSTLLIKAVFNALDEAGAMMLLLLICLFVIASVTLTIIGLMKLQKKWKNEK